jgi:hypothetical protein
VTRQKSEKSEGLESEYPLTRSLHVLDLSPESVLKKNTKCDAQGCETDFFRSSGTEHDRVFRANEDFVLDAHAKAVKMCGELRVGRNVYA